MARPPTVIVAGLRSELLARIGADFGAFVVSEDVRVIRRRGDSPHGQLDSEISNAIGTAKAKNDNVALHYVLSHDGRHHAREKEIVNSAIPRGTRLAHLQFWEFELALGVLNALDETFRGVGNPFSPDLLESRAVLGTVVCAQPSTEVPCLVQVAHSCFGGQSPAQFESRRIDAVNASVEANRLLQEFNSPIRPAGVLYSRELNTLQKINIGNCDFDGFDPKLFWQGKDPFSTVRTMLAYLRRED